MLSLQGVSVSVSVLTLTVIAIERWYAICHPLKFRSTTTRARVVILGIWVVSLVILLPDLVVLDIHRKFPGLTVLLTTCKPTWPYESQATYQMFLVIALFFLPSCLIGFCYCRIARALWSDSLPTETSKWRVRQFF